VTAPLFPVGLVVEGRACLVVGGGTVAARKAASLAECGAVVTVVAPEIGAALERPDIRQERRPYRSGEAAAYRLVIAASDAPAVNAEVYADAEAAGIWCNVVDDPAH
jgi:precorrin-2 dehydrogenase/sirohydrochlorin ferrochelatase